ncbi:uncharacterized protein YjbI with pentapeptide repeats [Variovorax boronicumulans]|uniref:DUF2169 family type VI secretion system accessory protein n=1 Tax=Variovorax boronicumulans TaxID=436515 RepID=UPI0024742F39|nr:DUF2169 domain-containing protein [Variovorax boronicumulans]MDH6168400.1 uncharacterized protein YjbI with pentapeptide repeats [Variovorax boronicumulans]
MKTVKPLRLGILTRPYRWQGADQLGVSVMALASLDAEPKLMADQELWQTIGEEIGDMGVFDMGVPKSMPEVLASGYGYTHHQPDKTACAVRLRVADFEKSLHVSGDRYWLDGRLTAPQSFEAMPLDWAHAYGGPGVPENTAGIGAFDEMVDGIHTRRAPNVEAVHARVHSRGQAVTPASFGAVPVDSPQRMALMGHKYGQDWLEKQFPGFADDMDWRFFNAAPTDQRWPARQEFPPGAPYEILNMHPRKPVLSGHLPDWRARCFASFDKEGRDLCEVALRLTTAWFFPHRERVALIWHGVLPVREDDAADVRHIMPALERPDAPRDMTHYQSVLLQRLDPARGGLLAFRDSDLAPKDILGRWSVVDLPDPMARPLVRNLRAGQLRDHESRRAELIAQGVDPDKYLPAPQPPAAPVAFDDVPDYFERMQEEMMETRKDLEAKGEQMRRKQEAEIDPTLLQQGRDRPKRFDPDELIRQLEQLTEAPPAQGGASPAASPQLISVGSRERMTAQINLGYLHGAHLSDAAPPMPSFRAAKIRRRLAEAAPGERRFAGMRLIGADLSGMDLRGADFSGASLEDANLDGAQLGDANFNNAVLARARLSRTVLANATFKNANLGGAQCEFADFSGADLSAANCEKARFTSCNMANAVFHQTRLTESEMSRCDLRGSDWHQVFLTRLRMHAMAFDGALLKQVVWLECALDDVRFVNATLERCGFVTTDCSRAVDFSDARLDASSFAHGSTLAGAVFRRATLKHCGLRTTPLTKADLGDAHLDNCDFSECDLQGANLDRLFAGESLFVRADLTGATLRGANLIDANFSKAVFTQADLSGANLFRTDVSQSLIDGTTHLMGAYTQHAKVWPARRVAAPE